MRPNGTKWDEAGREGKKQKREKRKQNYRKSTVAIGDAWEVGPME
jgi:hypothetical protein